MLNNLSSILPKKQLFCNMQRKKVAKNINFFIDFDLPGGWFG